MKKYSAYPEGTDDAIKEICGINQSGLILMIREYSDHNQWIDLNLLDIVIEEPTIANLANDKFILSHYDFVDIKNRYEQEYGECNSIIDSLQKLLQRAVFFGFYKVIIHSIYESNHEDYISDDCFDSPGCIDIIKQYKGSYKFSLNDGFLSVVQLWNYIHTLRGRLGPNIIVTDIEISKVYGDTFEIYVDLSN